MNLELKFSSQPDVKEYIFAGCPATRQDLATTSCLVSGLMLGNNTLGVERSVYALRDRLAFVLPAWLKCWEVKKWNLSNSPERSRPEALLAPPRKLHGALVLLTLGVVLFIFFLWAENGFSADALFKWDKRRSELLFNFYTGMVASVVASYVFLWLYTAEGSKLKKMRKLTNPEFLSNFLEDLREFESRTCHTYSAALTFTPIPERPDLLIVKIKYDYHKKVKQRHMRFKIARIRQGADLEALPDHDEAFFSHECYFKLNETDIETAPKEELYAFKHLLVNSNHLELKRVNQNDAVFYECEGEIPREVPIDGFVRLTYEVAFPMERESFLAINAELPTKNFDVFLDYSQLDGSLQVISQSFVGFLHGPNEIERSDSKHAIQLSYEGWLLPKNGVVFCWWKRP